MPAIAASASAALAACAYNEALGRNQLLIVDNGSLVQQSNAAWAEQVRTQNAVTTGAQVDRIRRIGDRLVQAAGLLIHALDVDDDEALIEQIRERYERPLKEIYEC